jgi:hypothetical protein
MKRGAAGREVGVDSVREFGGLEASIPVQGGHRAGCIPQERHRNLQHPEEESIAAFRLMRMYGARYPSTGGASESAGPCGGAETGRAKTERERAR